jgi:hypothetical protein
VKTAWRVIRWAVALFALAAPAFYISAAWGWDVPIRRVRRELLDGWVTAFFAAAVFTSFLAGFLLTRRRD